MNEKPMEDGESPRLFEVCLPIGGRKPRLPKRFCWPVGVEMLSSRFSRIPQADWIKVWFNDHPSSNYCLTMEQIANRRLPYRILTVWHHVLKHQARWYFMVYPVEASRRAAVRSLLQETAFAAMERWLCEERTPVWHRSSHHLDCIFDPNEQTLEVVERPCP